MSSFTVPTRVYVTAEDELVIEGDVRARFLKYGEGTELGGEEAEVVAALFAEDRDLADPPKGDDEPPADTELGQQPPEDKQGDPGQDKQADVKAALTKDGAGGKGQA